MYDILVYLFENCERADLLHNSELLAKKLSAAGFEDAEISEALTWLAGVGREPHRICAPLPDVHRAVRVYAAKELAKLDAGCRGFLISLEQSGILDAQTREQVLERALAAAGDALSLEQLKLIVLMVLWNEHTSTGLLIAEELLSANDVRLPN